MSYCCYDRQRSPRVGLGVVAALAPSGGADFTQSAWYLARHASGPTTTTYTPKGGVIIAPTEPVTTSYPTRTTSPTIREPAPTPTPTPEPAVVTSPTGEVPPPPPDPELLTSPTPQPSYLDIALPGGGGAGDVVVTVEGAEGALPPDADKPGFGMVEAAIAAGLAALLAAGWSRRKR